MLQTRTINNSEVLDTVPSKEMNLAIVGVNPIGQVLFHHTGKFIWPDHNLVGLIAITEEEKGNPEPENSSVLGTISEFNRIVHQHGISRVVLAVDSFDVHALHQLIQLCLREGIEYELAPAFYDITFGGALKYLFSRSGSFFEWSVVRGMDIFASSLLLFAFVPLWIFIALFIKLTSRGAVLQSQQRVGRNGRIFQAFKFRTIYASYEKYTSVPYVTYTNGLLTPIGKILKKTRLEDIPLLLNVLAGDMSIIGPEAEKPYYHVKYLKGVPFYENRLKIKPGLIGYSQVEIGERGTIEDIREKLRYDFYYVDHHDSFLLNTKIILKAFWQFSKGRKLS